MESGSLSSSEVSAANPVIQRVSPRIIPGSLTANNKHAIDWGWQSFVAYGCHNHVVVVDTTNIKIIQTLEKHKTDVVKVKWCRENHYHDLSNPYNLQLASADVSGYIIVWDVLDCTARCVLSDGSKAIAEMEWVRGNDSDHLFLLALHPPSSVVLWNTETGTKVWRKTYTETLQSFAFDPFSESNIAFLAVDCIIFVDDFNLKNPLLSTGKKFLISNPSSTAGSQSAINTVGTTGEDRSKRNSLARQVRLLIGVEPKNSAEDGVALNECLQLAYHRSYRHHLLLLYPREILILDLEIHQTVGIVAIERNSSPLAQMYTCWQRDLLMCLHEPGNVSLRIRHKSTMSAAVDEVDTLSVDTLENLMEMGYEMRCQSDSLRNTKHSKVFSMAVCPKGESKVVLLLSDGRLFFWDLIATQQINNSPRTGLNGSHSSDEISSHVQKHVPMPCKVKLPKTMLAEYVGPALYGNEDRPPSLKFIMTGLFSSLAPPPLTIRMCPPVTFRNWTVYQPLMAVGNSSGSVQVFNMATGILMHEFSLHTSPVRGVEWASLTAFFSWSFPNFLNNLGQVRNELVLTDVQSGRNKLLRSDCNEESPIELLKVSYQRQYFIIVFKEQPFEVWDLRNLALLRIMPKTFLTVTALDWSPLHSKKQQNSHQDELSDDSSKKMEDISIHQSKKNFTKEHFVFTDTDGQLHQFSVEGNVVRIGSRIPSDAGMGSITCIAWKNDQIVLGDVDGNLNLWDLKNKISRGIPTHRGWVRKIRFAPGRGNMKILILYMEGVDIWDVKEGKMISQVRCPKDMPKIQDVDWAGSDRPVICTTDGCIRITDILLKNCSSPILDYQPAGIPFCPSLLSIKGAFSLKSLLQHQPWSVTYDTELEDGSSLVDEDFTIARQQMDSLDQNLKLYLANCPFGTAERCQLVSRLFGDEEGLHFWTIALHYLKCYKVSLAEENKNWDRGDDGSISTGSKADGDVISMDDVSAEPFLNEPLDTCYDILMDNDSYKKLQLDRTYLHDYKRSSYAQTQRCVENLLLLRQWDRAVQLLLETEGDSDTVYTDCLRACLVATVKSSTNSQSVIKLVATNLIAGGRISEGVQLLCLIEKGLDGCRYLQSAGRWEQAVWLAKAILDQQECLEVMKRWVDHLVSTQVNQKKKGLLVLLSQFEFWKVLHLMHKWGMVERAAMFLCACQEFGLLTRTDSNSEILDAVFLNYARHLCVLGNFSGAAYYCDVVGSTAEDLKKEINQLFESK